MHINDYKGAVKDWSCLKTLHAGDGQIDFDRLFGFIKQSGYQGDFTIESTSFDKTGVIDFDKMNATIAKIRGLLGIYRGAAS
jgi:sugar phosphate isomerase/epimerase